MPAAIPIAMVAAAAIASNASSKASKAQAASAREAAASGNRQFDISRQDQLAQLAQQREDQAPYRKAGTDSLAALMAGQAPGGEFGQQYQRGAFETDPGYQFRLSEGERGIQNQARAGGGMYSGATLKALSRFNSGLASQEYGAWDARQNTAQSQFEGVKTNKFNRLATLAGVGQTANNTLGAAGQAVNANIAALGGANAARQAGYLQDAAEARAAGYVGQANALGQGIKGLGEYYQQQQAMNQSGYTPPPDNASYDGYGGPGNLY